MSTMHIMSFELTLKSIALGMMIVLSIVGNMGVCWVTYNTRNTEPVTAMLMMNMAATDFLRGVLDMPFAFITMVSRDTDHWLLGDTVCQLTAFVSQTLCLASTLSVACVSIDRYCTIVYPLDYQVIMTQRRAKVMLVLTWLAAAVISLFPVWGVGLYRFLPATHHCTSDWTFSPAYSVSVLATGFLIPLAITSVCNFRIFRAARSQSRRVRELSSRGGDSTSGSSERSRPRGHQQQRQAWRPPRHRAHAAKIILVIFGTFFCCWAAYVATHIWNVIRALETQVSWSKNGDPSGDPYNTTCWWITLVTFVAYTNAVISPYVYTLLNRRLRKTLRKLLIRLCCPTGRVDYRRSTIVFATNVSNRCRSTRKGGLFGHRWRENEEFHTSEMTQQSSFYRSNREALPSFSSTHLHATNPTDSSYYASCSATSSSTPPARRRGPVPQLTYDLDESLPGGPPDTLQHEEGGLVLPPLWCLAENTKKERKTDGTVSTNQICTSHKGRCLPESISSEKHDDNSISPKSLNIPASSDGTCIPVRKLPKGGGRLSPLFVVSDSSVEPPFRLPDFNLLGADLTRTHKKSLRWNTVKKKDFSTRAFQTHPHPKHWTDKMSKRTKCDLAKGIGAAYADKEDDENKERLTTPAKNLNHAHAFPSGGLEQAEKLRKNQRRRPGSIPSQCNTSRQGSTSSQEIPMSSLKNTKPSKTPTPQEQANELPPVTLQKIAWCRRLSGTLSKCRRQRSETAKKKKAPAPRMAQSKL